MWDAGAAIGGLIYYGTTPTPSNGLKDIQQIKRYLLKKIQDLKSIES